MNNQIKILIIIISISLVSCGYKPLNYNSNFKIVDIQSRGDSKINFILKNKINRNHFNDDAINIIKLEINSNKNKIIKEKNIQNEITKYSLIISVKVIYYTNGQNNKRGFNMSKSGDFTVAANYSQTLTNEKNALDLLMNEIADDINRKLLIDLSDI